MTKLDPEIQRSIAARDKTLQRSSQPLDSSVEAATAFGVRTARRLTRVHECDSPTDLAAAESVTVRRDSWKGFERQRILGGFRVDDNEIVLYHRQIEGVVEATDIPTDTAEALVVAHELGHSVMPRDEPTLCCQTPTKLSRLLPWQSAEKLRPSSGLREAAAHAFTAELIDSPLDHPDELLRLTTDTDITKQPNH